MRGFPAELIYVLVFAGVVLIQLLATLLRRTRRPELPPETHTPAPPRTGPSDTPSGDRPLRPTDLSASVAAPAEWLHPPPGVPSPKPARALRRYSRQALFGTQRDVQNAVVMATILGPCRALDPDQRQTRRPVPVSVSETAAAGRT